MIDEPVINGVISPALCKVLKSIFNALILLTIFFVIAGRFETAWFRENMDQNILHPPEHLYQGATAAVSPQPASLNLVGVGFDGTACFRKGAAAGPAAIRRVSEDIETYSPYLDRDLEEIHPFYDLGDLALSNCGEPLRDWDSARRLLRGPDRRGATLRPAFWPWAANTRSPASSSRRPWPTFPICSCSISMPTPICGTATRASITPMPPPSGAAWTASVPATGWPSSASAPVPGRSSTGCATSGTLHPEDLSQFISLYRKDPAARGRST